MALRHVLQLVNAQSCFLPAAGARAAGPRGAGEMCLLGPGGQVRGVARGKGK